MNLFKRWRGRRDVDRDLADEIRAHLDARVEELVDVGVSHEEARQQARRELGNATLLAERSRDVWRFGIAEDSWQDLRYALRTMRRNPMFTALVVLSLALGTGATTTIYSFMDSLLLRPLAVPNPSSLVLLNWHGRRPEGPRPNHVMHGSDGSAWVDGAGMTSGIFPFGVFEVLRSNAVLSTVFAYYPTEERNVTVRDHAEQAAGEYVSGDYFRGLAVTPVAGRLIQPDDDRAGAPLVLVISTRTSQRRFSGPASAIGQTVLVDNLPFTVVGVTPANFSGVDPEMDPEFYVPLHANLVLDGNESWAKSSASYRDPNYYWVELMGRLAPGVTLAQAQVALAPVFDQWVAATASNAQERASLPALALQNGARGSDSLRRQFSQPLYVLFAIASLILAIACANTGNLLLSRATARRREMAVRLSMGAGRLRLIRQLVTESLVLSLIGGGLGLALALWGMGVLSVLLANGQENFTLRAELSWHVLAVSFVVSTLCGVAFGLAPAVQSTRVDLVQALKRTRLGDARCSARVGLWQRSLGPALLVTRIVISLILLAVGGLFVRTLSSLQAIPIGFNPNNVALFTLNARQAGHNDPEILAFYEDLRSQFAAIPGVGGATLSHASLLGAGRRLDVRVAGERVSDVWILQTGARFFSTMQIPMLRGREIDERDGPDSAGVVVVNALFVKKYFGNVDPLGRRVTLGGPHPRDMEIVGVASNAHYGPLKDDPRMVCFIPYNQGDYPRVQQMVYALRTSGDPLALSSTVRDIVRRADARIPVVNSMTVTSEIERGMNQEIILARLCTAFALLALAIAIVGLYGTVAYTVERRTVEIGLRLALGAQRRGVIQMVLRQVLWLVVTGLVVGFPLAMGASRLIESFLFGVKAMDPLTLIIAVAILVVAALLAGYVPARRASRTDPLAALRQD